MYTNGNVIVRNVRKYEAISAGSELNYMRS